MPRSADEHVSQVTLEPATGPRDAPRPRSAPVDLDVSDRNRVAQTKGVPEGLDARPVRRGEFDPTRLGAPPHLERRATEVSAADRRAVHASDAGDRDPAAGNPVRLVLAQE